MTGGFGWTAASLIPTNPVSAAVVPTSTSTSGPGTQTATPASVPQLDVTKNMNAILQKILGPNYSLGKNPSPIVGSSSLYSPNYLAQVQAGTAPQSAVDGFTQFGNSFWKMPPTPPPNSTALSSGTSAPAATNFGAPSAWVSNKSNLFNI